MNINELIKLQNEFDKKHNWVPKSNDTRGIIEAINRDIIGTIGELGEFSNLVKKINLRLDADDNNQADKIFSNQMNHMREEIIDTLIYLMRIASHLNIDVEREYYLKLTNNKAKYKDFEIDE